MDQQETLLLLLLLGIDLCLNNCREKNKDYKYRADANDFS
jgi:hypothetical protein